jgi:hypothetical protein
LFQNPFKWVLQILGAVVLVGGLAACTSEQSKLESTENTPAKVSKNQEKQEVLKNNISLSSSRGTIRNRVDFTVDELEPNAPV